MKKKLNQEAGFTLVEMLAATLILILLAMMLSTGLQMTVRSYQKITAESEVELLMSTAMDALADDLRFARGVKNYVDPVTGMGEEDLVPFVYTSDSFKGEIHLEIRYGQIIVKDNSTSDGGINRFLSTGVYGGKPEKGEYAYEVTRMEIEPDKDKRTFTIKLEVQSIADESIKAYREITVRCLNDMSELN